MNEFSWIMSYGGPLICVEPVYAASWGGSLRLTVESGDATSDYERVDHRPKFLQRITLREASAIIIMEGAHDTSFWQQPECGNLFVVQIIYCEEDVDLNLIMRQIDNDVFTKSSEVLDFYFDYSKLIVFDSVEEGNDSEKKSITATISPGRYKILSQI